jgi:hypothetical protein
MSISVLFIRVKFYASLIVISRDMQEIKKQDKKLPFFTYYIFYITLLFLFTLYIFYYRCAYV